jgi:hypothetical protein
MTRSASYGIAMPRSAFFSSNSICRMMAAGALTPLVRRLCPSHQVRENQPAFRGAAEPSFMARLEFGLSQFLFGSLSALGRCEHVYSQNITRQENFLVEAAYARCSPTGPQISPPPHEELHTSARAMASKMVRADGGAQILYSRRPNLCRTDEDGNELAHDRGFGPCANQPKKELLFVLSFGLGDPEGRSWRACGQSCFFAEPRAADAGV